MDWDSSRPSSLDDRVCEAVINAKQGVREKHFTSRYCCKLEKHRAYRIPTAYGWKTLEENATRFLVPLPGFAFDWLPTPETRERRRNDPHSVA